MIYSSIVLIVNFTRIYVTSVCINLYMWNWSEYYIVLFCVFCYIGDFLLEVAWDIGSCCCILCCISVFLVSVCKIGVRYSLVMLKIDFPPVYVILLFLGLCMWILKSYIVLYCWICISSWFVSCRCLSVCILDWNIVTYGWLNISCRFVLHQC